MSREWDVVPGYEPLAEVFQAALDQSQRHKGKERHSSGQPFLQQPIAEIGRMVGVGYNVGQAMKKGQESMRLPDDRAQAELLGAMVYLASAYLLIGERMEAEKREMVANTIPANYAAHRDDPQVEVNVGETWVVQKANATALTTVVIDDISEHTVVMSPQGAQYLGKELQRKQDIRFVGRVKDPAAHKAPSLCDSEVGPESPSAKAVTCNWLYQGSCAFVTQCGREYTYEGPTPNECPCCGGRVFIAGLTSAADEPARKDPSPVIAAAPCQVCFVTGCPAVGSKRWVRCERFHMPTVGDTHEP